MVSCSCEKPPKKTNESKFSPFEKKLRSNTKTSEEDEFQNAPKPLSKWEAFSLAGKCAQESNKLMEKQGFTASCAGGACRGTYRTCGYSYNTTQYRFTNIDDARILLIEKALKFAEPFNNEKQIRMFLHNFPFDLNNVELSITFTDENGIKLPPPYISTVFNGGGRIFYFQSDYITIHKERIEEGLKIYKEYKSNIEKQKE